jgi:hypothetical protein
MPHTSGSWASALTRNDPGVLAKSEPPLGLAKGIFWRATKAAQPRLDIWTCEPQEEKTQSVLELHKQAKGRGTPSAVDDDVNSSFVAGLKSVLHGVGQFQPSTPSKKRVILHECRGPPNGAYLLFTLGLIGTGMLGVPVLVGSCAYAMAEGAA